MAVVTAWPLLALTTGCVAVGLAARRARLARRALLREKQRRIALRQPCQCGGDVQQRGFVLALVIGQQRTEPVQFLAALPYLATIVVLVVISHDRKVLQNNLPASLGKPFLP